MLTLGHKLLNWLNFSKATIKAGSPASKENHMPRQEHHKSLTLARVEHAVKREMFGLDDPGFCLKCGEEQGGCEPDAEGYKCEECGTNTVYGAMEVLFRGNF